FEGREASRSAGCAVIALQARHQSQDRQDARPRSASDAARPRRRGDRMRRREFIALMVAASSYAWPFAALAQVPTTRPRITYIGGSGPKPSAKVTGAFIEGMRALGYTEGRDFEMEYRWAEGYLERLPALAEESVRRGSDVIVVANPQAAVAAKD